MRYKHEMNVQEYASRGGCWYINIYYIHLYLIYVYNTANTSQIPHIFIHILIWFAKIYIQDMYSQYKIYCIQLVTFWLEKFILLRKFTVSHSLI